jgi:hypothetical protein
MVLCSHLGFIGEMLQGTAAALPIEWTGRESAMRRGGHDFLKGGKAVGLLFHVNGNPYPVSGRSQGDEIDLAVMPPQTCAAMGKGRYFEGDGFHGTETERVRRCA